MADATRPHARSVSVARLLAAAALALYAAPAAGQPAGAVPATPVPVRSPIRVPLDATRPAPTPLPAAGPAGTTDAPPAGGSPDGFAPATPAGDVTTPGIDVAPRPALPSDLIPETPAGAAAATAAPEPGSDRGLVLPAYSGDPATALGDEALFASLTPLRKAWFIREYYRQRGDAPNAAKATETLLELRLDSGLENATAIAAALAAEARALMADGKSAEAAAAAAAATKMAPDHPGAWATLARAELGAGGVGPAFSAADASVRASLRNLRSRLRILGNGGLALIAGALVAYSIFLLFAFARHARFVAHDFRHALADNMPGWLATIILLPVLVFPLVFGAGPLALLAWLTVVLWMKLSIRERVIAALFLLFGAGLPVLLEKASTTLAFEGGGAGRLFTLVREDELSTRDFEDLTAIAERDGDADALLALGIAHQRAGRYAEAQTFYERAREAGAGAAALVGLGNVHYALGRLGEAIAAYEQARQADPSSVAAHFNLSQIHAERTDLANSTAALEAAKRLDAARCAAFSRNMLPPARKDAAATVPGAPPVVASAYANRFLMVQPVSDAALLARAARGASAVAARTWAVVSPSLPLQGVTAVFVAALAVCGLLTLAFRGAIASRPCPRCGRSLCLRCDGPPLEDDLCVQCYHAFVQDEGVDPKQRAAKEMEISRNRERLRRRRRVFSLVIPGAGQLFAGETVRGTVLLLVASVAAVRLVFWRGWFRPVFPSGATIAPIAAAAAAGAVLFVVWLVALRSRPADELVQGGGR